MLAHASHVVAQCIVPSMSMRHKRWQEKLGKPVLVDQLGTVGADQLQGDLAWNLSNEIVVFVQLEETVR